MKLSRGIQILQHYRWIQIYRRCTREGLRRLHRATPIGEIRYPEPLTPSVSPIFAKIGRVIVGGFGNHLQHRHSRLAEGKLVLLNAPCDVGWPLDWCHPQTQCMPHLWKFQFQYMEYLLAEIADAETEARAAAWHRVWDTLHRWVTVHDPREVARNSDSWHPFCISRRVPVWIWLLATCPDGSEQHPQILASLHQQCSHLHDHLEFDPGGNHLLENLTALALAASFLQTSPSRQWMSTVSTLLPGELSRQLLSTGEHFERSPMYHCQVLRNLLVVALCSRETQPDLAGICRQSASQMLEFLGSILHPDGEIPLFADSGFGEAPSLAEIRSLAALAELQLPQLGPGVTVCGQYWIHEGVNQPSDRLIFDGGDVGARELPAHAHCDLLNLEASVGGSRWFVDSGNFNYQDDAMRRYCRSSLAHNVATIENQNSCEIWSQFRMGFRGKVQSFATYKSDGVDWVVASHNGYRRQGCRCMTRLVAAGKQPFWLVADHAAASSSRSLVAYLHLAVDLRVQPLDDPHSFLLQHQQQQRLLTFFGIQGVEISQGWYCKAFGFREKKSALVYDGLPGSSPAGWVLTPLSARPRVDVAKGRLKLTFPADSDFEFEWELPS